LRAWLLSTRASGADGSGTANALDYSLKRWPALCRYATAGHLPIDNNPVENDIRPIALGKNYPRSTIRQGLSVPTAEGQSQRGFQHSLVFRNLA
jgi:hypothetical protein